MQKEEGHRIWHDKASAMIIIILTLSIIPIIIILLKLRIFFRLFVKSWSMHSTQLTNSSFIYQADKRKREKSGPGPFFHFHFTIISVDLCFFLFIPSRCHEIRSNSSPIISPDGVDVWRDGKLGGRDASFVLLMAPFTIVPGADSHIVRNASLTWREGVCTAWLRGRKRKGWGSRTGTGNGGMMQPWRMVNNNKGSLTMWFRLRGALWRTD